MINKSQIKDIIIKEASGIMADSISDDTNLFDAGIDSLDHMSIIFAIQEKFNVIIDENDIDNCVSISSIMNYINKK